MNHIFFLRLLPICTLGFLMSSLIGNAKTVAVVLPVHPFGALWLFTRKKQQQTIESNNKYILEEWYT